MNENLVPSSENHNNKKDGEMAYTNLKSSSFNSFPEYRAAELEFKRKTKHLFTISFFAILADIAVVCAQFWLTYKHFDNKLCISLGVVALAIQAFYLLTLVNFLYNVKKDNEEENFGENARKMRFLFVNYILVTALTAAFGYNDLKNNQGFLAFAVGCFAIHGSIWSFYYELAMDMRRLSLVRKSVAEGSLTNDARSA
eukprot:TRINITY_DN2029_c0_g1_i10.p3 TRINITY_DN2029_c0_g1~~TRINITY_DN2029_c0_g1_i10.p3  ORF type:complete len:198 (+),score=41.95 TRINITY_DN2029_c0_g1_i10:1219-1812(+)